MARGFRVTAPLPPVGRLEAHDGRDPIYTARTRAVMTSSLDRATALLIAAGDGLVSCGYGWGRVRWKEWDSLVSCGYVEGGR